MLQMQHAARAQLDMRTARNGIALLLSASAQFPVDVRVSSYFSPLMFPEHFASSSRANGIISGTFQHNFPFCNAVLSSFQSRPQNKVFPGRSGNLQRYIHYLTASVSVARGRHCAIP